MEKINKEKEGKHTDTHIPIYPEFLVIKLNEKLQGIINILSFFK